MNIEYITLHLEIDKNINEENITVMPVCLSEKQVTLKNFDNSNINLFRLQCVGRNARN